MCVCLLSLREWVREFYVTCVWRICLPSSCNVRTEQSLQCGEPKDGRQLPQISENVHKYSILPGSDHVLAFRVHFPSRYFISQSTYLIVFLLLWLGHLYLLLCHVVWWENSVSHPGFSTDEAYCGYWTLLRLPRDYSQISPFSRQPSEYTCSILYCPSLLFCYMLWLSCKPSLGRSSSLVTKSKCSLILCCENKRYLFFQ
jgi:hypothetical protein